METKEDQKISESTASAADAGASGDADFGAPIAMPDLADSAQLSSSRISVLYDASSMFECAAAATLKCEKATAALPGHSEYATVVKDILACNPHVIIILGMAWPDAFYKTLFSHSAQTKTSAEAPLVLVLCDRAKQSTHPHVLYVEPTLFTKLAPCKSEISAYMIFSHLIRGEYPLHFKDQLEEARYFKLALRSSIGSTLQAYTFVENIVNNWQHVMDPENLVLYGRFLTTVGPNIARKRVADHSVLIKLGNHTVRVVECPDFEEVTMNVALARDPIVVAYSMSADTTQCHLTCRMRNDISAFADASAKADTSAKADSAAPAPTPREILALITPRAEIGPESTSDGGDAHVTCVSTDFFAIVRTSIIQQQSAQVSLGPTEEAMIVEGEKVLKEAAPLLEGKN